MLCGLRFAVGALRFCSGAAIANTCPDRVLLATSSSVAAPRVEAFQRGLRELGYVEGKNIAIEWRYAENERRLASFTAELLHLKVNVIVTVESQPAPLSKQHQRFRLS